ncbi:hypothetical protein CTRI78_v008359 [Colletotrichum trifolii]|uniref:WSC domain-containing protein n=1 Tax=Colletotrichum trifolii TaxID=5466 RepID=A0A4R8QWH7_COLTR|nr:hypothetical protein CTRI78_v008359 [Colletotrichum trifolii]
MKMDLHEIPFPLYRDQHLGDYNYNRDQHKYYRNINDRSYLDNYDWVHLLDYNRREHYCENYVNDKLVFFFRDFYRVNDNVDDIFCQFVFIGNFYRAYDNVDQLVFFVGNLHRANNPNDIYHQLFFFVFIRDFHIHRANNNDNIYQQFVFIRDLHRANNDFHYVYLNYQFYDNLVNYFIGDVLPTNIDNLVKFREFDRVKYFVCADHNKLFYIRVVHSVNSNSDFNQLVNYFFRFYDLDGSHEQHFRYVHHIFRELHSFNKLDLYNSTPVPSSTVDNTPSTTQQTTSASASASGVIALAVINGGAPIAIEEIFNLQPGEAAVVELEFIDPETGQPTKAVVVFQALGCRGVPPGESPFGGRTTSIGSDYVQASCAVYCSRNRFTFTSVNRGVCYCGSEQKELTLIDQSQCAAAGNNKKRHWFRKRQSGGAVDAVNLFAVIPAADVVITPATTTLSPSSLPTLPLANTGPLSTIVTTRFWVYLDWVWDSFDPFR